MDHNDNITSSITSEVKMKIINCGVTFKIFQYLLYEILEIYFVKR